MMLTIEPTAPLDERGLQAFLPSPRLFLFRKQRKKSAYGIFYNITHRQPEPLSSPALWARIEPLLPVLPAPSASSSSRSAGLTVMWTTFELGRAKGRSRYHRKISFVRFGQFEGKNLTFQAGLIINHPPHDDQPDTTRVARPRLPLRPPVRPDQLFELVAAHLARIEVAARVECCDFARGEVLL